MIEINCLHNTNVIWIYCVVVVLLEVVTQNSPTSNGARIPVTETHGTEPNPSYAAEINEQTTAIDKYLGFKL